MSAGSEKVSELEESLGIRQPTLSQQLTVLRSEGLVNTRRDGKRIFILLLMKKFLCYSIRFISFAPIAG